MSHNPPIIKDGALFIADAHFNPDRKEFLRFLKNIENGNLNTTQLFLMGDIFDFLSNEIEYFKFQNKEAIDMINKLSKEIEILYFEGNHDYNLTSLFPNVKVFPRAIQPTIFSWDNKKVTLAHGDIFTPNGYNIYTAIIRNNFLLIFLNFIDKRNWLTKKIDFWLRKKQLHSLFNDFNHFANRRLKYYRNNIDTQIIIEGHFHQGKFYQDKRFNQIYLNLPAFGIDQSYMMIQKKEFTLCSIHN
jgi:UDP-2,3-diacylglucosamine hydrolase